MKRKIQSRPEPIPTLLIVGALVIAWLTMDIMAQSTEPAYHGVPEGHQDKLHLPDRVLPNSDRTQAELPEMMEGLPKAIEADALIGRALIDAQGENLGNVSDLAVDFDDSWSAAIIVGYGGVLGIGKGLVAMPPALLTEKTGDQQEALTVNLTTATLENAPSFRWDAENPYELIRAAYRHLEDSMPRGAVARENVRDQFDPGLTDTPLREKRFGMGEEGKTHDGYDGTNGTQIAPLLQASKILRKYVKDSNGENVGRLENLIVDLKSGRIIAGIISSGGLLGIGKTLHALPPAQMTLDEGGKEIRLRLTREQLEKAPRYSAGGGNLDEPQWWKDFDAHFEGGEFHKSDRGEPGLDRLNIQREHHELQQRHRDVQKRSLDGHYRQQEAPHHGAEGQQSNRAPQQQD
jgi:sporulation protein YlmC with PRC-barrel domain